MGPGEREEGSTVVSLGSGGVERWVAYPLLLWVPAFGGYPLGVGAATEPRR